MRAFRFLNLAILSIVVAGASAVYAQDAKPQDRPARPEEPKAQEEAKPQPKQDETKPPRQDEAKPSKQQKQEQKQDEKQSRDQMQMKDNRQPASQQDAHAHPAGKGGHIPDDKFRANFGRSHTFVVQRTTVVQGQSGFVYGGYSFGFVDPWPADWAYTDDCYVDYIDGEYFLFDLLHPGVRIALFVVM
jgi:hypothetical protein